MDGIEWARAKWGIAARAYLKVMEAFAMYTPNRIIADARGIKEFLEGRHRRMPPCEVIPYGANVVDAAPKDAAIRDLGIRPGGYYLAVCRLEPENHVLEIIEGFNASGSALPLVIVGNHDIDAPYIKRLKTAGGRGVKFIGAIYDKARLKALRYHCTAYFHGHSVGGTNPSLIEALGCGNAVIAHDNPFNREVAGETGFYFKGPEEIPALTARIAGLSGAERMEIGARARRIVSDRYGWDGVTGAYLRLLDGLRRHRPDFNF